MPASQAGRRRFESDRPLWTESLRRTRVECTQSRRLVRLSDPPEPGSLPGFAAKRSRTMPSRSSRIPSYRLHKPSGQAVVTLAGKDHYLGLHGTPQSRAAYDRLITEYLSTRGQQHTGKRATSALTI